MIHQLLVLIVIIATLSILSGATIAVPASTAALENNNNIQHISGSVHDCSEGANGCAGNVYCDLNDKGSCYDRNEGNDDGSSTDPQSSTYEGSANPQPPLYK
jgi:hypothetical protein